ncbi:MAG: hypothetical protein GYB20_17460 [Oceanospirillales bacterium]|nr:hypothetical protein [Oceanospirillales bacterium]MBR9889470.1 hypothetical protein [Oceanospirillales bacterium]
MPVGIAAIKGACRLISCFSRLNTGITSFVARLKELAKIPGDKPIDLFHPIGITIRLPSISLAQMRQVLLCICW